MTRQQRRKQEPELPEPAKSLARQDAIRQMCQGEFDTDYHRALAECFLDYKEGKITKEKYEELTKMKG
jgi:hypothetical protein